MLLSSSNSKWKYSNLRIMSFTNNEHDTVMFSIECFENVTWFSKHMNLCNVKKSSLRGESVRKRKTMLTCEKFREEGVNNPQPPGEKTFAAVDRLNIFCWNLLRVCKKFIDTPFEKKWLLHDDVIAEASTFPRLGSTRQYTIFEISASLFCMELKFSPEFQLNKWWNCIISSWPLLWSVLYTFKKSVLSRCCKRIYYSPAVQNTSILQTVV